MNLEEYREERRKTRDDFSEKTTLNDVAAKKRARKNRIFTSVAFLFLGICLGILISGVMYIFMGGKITSGQTQIIMGQKDEADVTTIRKGEHLEEGTEGAEIFKDASLERVETSDAVNSQTDGSSYSNASLNTNDDMAVKEILKTSLSEGEGTMVALRKVFDDEIMVTNGGDFYFIEKDPSIKANSYSADNLSIDEKGRYVYTFEDGSVARQGVDVSKYQGEIDWEKVKNDGIDFAFIRGGIRGYETGKLVPEEEFLENALAASAAGVEIGVYFFSQARTVEEAKEEADCVLEILDGQEIAFPIVCDIEMVSGGRLSDLTKDQITENCLAFCNEVKEKGYTPMIYGNMATYLLLLDLNKIADIDKWFAYYNNDFYYPYEYSIWQYSESGKVDGIKGEVDLNICFDKP